MSNLNLEVEIHMNSDEAIDKLKEISSLCDDVNLKLEKISELNRKLELPELKIRKEDKVD